MLIRACCSNNVFLNHDTAQVIGPEGQGGLGDLSALGDPGCLNVINIVVPPLRERQQDIPQIAQFFLEKFNRERNKRLKFSKKSLLMLESYDFPGNVRELRNIIEDAFVFTEGQYIQPEKLSFRKSVLQPEDIERDNPLHLLHNIHKLTREEAQLRFEKEYYSRLLQAHFWNIHNAAKIAGHSREWLSKKLKRLGLKNVN